MTRRPHPLQRLTDLAAVLAIAGTVLAYQVARAGPIGLIVERVAPTGPLLDRRVLVVSPGHLPTTEALLALLLQQPSDGGELLLVAGGRAWPEGWAPLPDARLLPRAVAFVRAHQGGSARDSLDVGYRALCDRGEGSLAVLAGAEELRPVADLPVRVFAIESRDEPWLHRLATDGLYLVAPGAQP